MHDNGYDTTADTRVKIAKVAINMMLIRASRIVNVAEAPDGRIAILPVDTFRMNMMALAAALDGETSAERLALDGMGAAAIAEILHEAEGQTTITVPTDLIEQARQLYSTAALAGREVEARGLDINVANQLYRPVAAAAMMLGEILSRATGAENGEHDAG